MSRMIIERVLPPGDYMTRLNELWAAYNAAIEDEAKETGGEARLMLEGSASEELREQYEALRDESKQAARDARRLVRLEGVSRSKKRELGRKFPPRKEGADDDTLKADESAGMNLDAVEDDLLYATIIEPEFKNRADFDEWADEALTEGEFQLLVRDAWQLANVAQFDPKSLPASPTQRSDATSE